MGCALTTGAVLGGIFRGLLEREGRLRFAHGSPYWRPYGNPPASQKASKRLFLLVGGTGLEPVTPAV